MASVRSLIFILTVLISFSSFAKATDVLDVAETITVESSTIAGVDVELVHFGQGQTLVVPADLASLKNRAHESALNLSAEDMIEIREVSRAALELTLRSVLAGDYSSAVALSAPESTFVAPFIKRLFAKEPSLYQSMPQDLNARRKLWRLVRTGWQFLLVETVHAGIDYWKQFKRVAPHFHEFGFAFDFKIEPQIFIGKFNPTSRWRKTSRNYAFYFQVAYNHRSKSARMHTAFRREKGAGGLGMPALKIEGKIYESDGFEGPFKGRAWYPVSPPAVSFVFDSSDHYFAQGITLGLNTGDLIPLSTLTNTFTTFVQGQDGFGVTEVPRKVSDAFTKAKKKIGPAPRTEMCSTLFARN